MQEGKVKEKRLTCLINTPGTVSPTESLNSSISRYPGEMLLENAIGHMTLV